MKDPYAASLLLSQYRNGTTVNAALTLIVDGQSRQVTVEWPNLGDINSNQDVLEWLYSALSRTITNYDDHTITSVVIEPYVPLGEEVSREA